MISLSDILLAVRMGLGTITASLSLYITGTGIINFLFIANWSFQESQEFLLVTHTHTHKKKQ